MDSEDEMKRDFEGLVARGRNRVCQRRQGLYSDPHFEDIQLEDTDSESEQDYWVSTFTEDQNAMAPPAPSPCPAAAHPAAAAPHVCALPDPCASRKEEVCPAPAPNKPAICRKDPNAMAPPCPPAPPVCPAAAHPHTCALPDPCGWEVMKYVHAPSVPAVHRKESDTLHRVLGEIAFQLDRRILTYIFTDKIRLYGFRIADISANIKEVGGACGRCAEMNARNCELMSNLRKFGYCPVNHSTFAEFIVNTYGILKEKPDCQTTLDNFNDRDYLQKLVTENTPPPLLQNMMVLLNCLLNLSVADGKPLFIW
ncbi:speriolin-like protein [Scyliorhinus canicula]|uniref:speriolin-like protein n=1 Tax=Scyliorhinus canicula TaxID=7830 RepID=UPI0018F68C49|nr:speriolin-like protein [Scyliorhinus canicula]XP_038654555.1 speriolin-like protein [Scyliorhinus canicula]